MLTSFRDNVLMVYNIGIGTLWVNQFNSIQFNTDICTRQLMNITLARTGEETKLQRKIKYMNDKRKKSVNFEKVLNQCNLN